MNCRLTTRHALKQVFCRPSTAQYQVLSFLLPIRRFSIAPSSRQIAQSLSVQHTYEIQEHDGADVRVPSTSETVPEVIGGTPHSPSTTSTEPSSPMQQAHQTTHKVDSTANKMKNIRFDNPNWRIDKELFNDQFYNDIINYYYANVPETARGTSREQFNQWNIFKSDFHQGFRPRYIKQLEAMAPDQNVDVSMILQEAKKSLTASLAWCIFLGQYAVSCKFTSTRDTKLEVYQYWYPLALTLARLLVTVPKKERPDLSEQFLYRPIYRIHYYLPLLRSERKSQVRRGHGLIVHMQHDLMRHFQDDQDAMRFTTHHADKAKKAWDTLQRFGRYPKWNLPLGRQPTDLEIQLQIDTDLENLAKVKKPLKETLTGAERWAAMAKVAERTKSAHWEHKIRGAEARPEIRAIFYGTNQTKASDEAARQEPSAWRDTQQIEEEDPLEARAQLHQWKLFQNAQTPTPVEEFPGPSLYPPPPTPPKKTRIIKFHAQDVPEPDYTTFTPMLHRLTASDRTHRGVYAHELDQHFTPNLGLRNEPMPTSLPISINHQYNDDSVNTTPQLTDSNSTSSNDYDNEPLRPLVRNQPMNKSIIRNLPSGAPIDPSYPPVIRGVELRTQPHIRAHHVKKPIYRNGKLVSDTSDDVNRDGSLGNPNESSFAVRKHFMTRGSPMKLPDFVYKRLTPTEVVNED